MSNDIQTLQPVYGWDWSATTHEGRIGQAYDLVDALGAEIFLPGKGTQGWSSSVQGFDREGYLLGSVFYGGDREDVHVLSTSEAADTSRWAVIGKHGARTARVDTRVDTLVEFDDLTALCEDAASAYGSRLTSYNSWDPRTGESHGRTLYVGAPSSAVRVRVYEKWLESPGQYQEGTNRVEVQLRPPSKVKAAVSGWTPAQTFCASRVTRSLAALLGDRAAPVASLHVKRGTPDLERSLAAMGEQYGNTVEKWLKVSGGDMDKVWGHLIRSENA